MWVQALRPCQTVLAAMIRSYALYQDHRSMLFACRTTHAVFNVDIGQGQGPRPTGLSCDLAVAHR